LIKDGSPPVNERDINMVFTLPAEFKGVEEEIAQLSLGPMEAVVEKHEESSQHLKLLYVRGHIDERPISRMLVDGSATINLITYSVFKKLGREDGNVISNECTKQC
jgi:hypothetical protein